MSIDDIVSRVRLAIDEEVVNDTSFGDASAGDSSKMENIIRASIGTALHWVCLHAPVEMLSGKDKGTDQTETTFIADIDNASTADITNGGTIIGVRLSVAADFLRLVRVRATGWHRAVMVPLSEDSDEYLQLYDSNGAAATADRPQAALIHSATKAIEAFPKPTGTGAKVVYTYVKDPLAGGATDYSTGTTGPSVPAKAQAALIYYIAFLVLSAYGDPRAARMLEIAMMNIGQKP